MDEEDFSEHGIAPKVLKIKSDYKETLPSSEAGVSVKANTADFILDHLIKPVSSTVGVRMLRKMGWREGQGIGPKIKKKLRKLKSKIAHGNYTFLFCAGTYFGLSSSARYFFIIYCLTNVYI